MTKYSPLPTTYPLLCLDQTLVSLLTFSKAPERCLFWSSRKHKKMERASFLGFSWEWASHRKLLFLPIPNSHFPFHVQPSLQRVCLTLLVPPLPFSVWFWDACRFRRSAFTNYFNSSFLSLAIILLNKRLSVLSPNLFFFHINFPWGKFNIKPSPEKKINDGKYIYVRSKNIKWIITIFF